MHRPLRRNSIWHYSTRSTARRLGARARTHSETPTDSTQRDTKRHRQRMRLHIRPLAWRRGVTWDSPNAAEKPSCLTMWPRQLKAEAEAPTLSCTRTLMVSRGFVTIELTTPAEMPAMKCTGIPWHQLGARRARKPLDPSKLAHHIAA